jgi:drug/metabolite transporter (DMT)-like permease
MKAFVSLLRDNRNYPPLAMPMGIWFLGEHVTHWTGLGAAVIFAGIYLVERSR